MKRLFILVIFLSIFIPSFAQNTPDPEVDSLMAIWENADLERSQRLKAIRDLVYEKYLFTRPDSAYLLADTALSFARESNDLYWMIRLSQLMGISLAIRGNNESAIELFQKSLDWSYERNDTADIATNLGSLGNVYFDLGDYQRAIQNHMDAMKIFEKVEDDENTSVSYSAIGIIYSKMEDYKNALAYFEKALELEKTFPDESRSGVTYHNIGSVYGDLGENEKSLEYYLESLRIKEKNDYKVGIPVSLASIGNAYKKLNKYADAKTYLEKAIRESKAIGNKRAECTSLIYMGDLLLQEKEYLKSKEIGEMALSLANEIGDTGKIKEAYEHLYMVHKSLGNKSEALQMYEQFISLRDTINSEENNRELIRQQFKYDYEKREALARAEQEKKDALSKADLQRQKTIRNASLGGFGLMLISTLVFFMQRNKIRKEKAISQDLLLNILPSEVAEELKAKGSADAKLFDHATVLFTDFKQFTDIAEKLSPSDLVREIDTCFKAFDEIIDKYHIEKIKTIGDAYMAAGGLPTPNSMNALDVVHAALEIRDFMLRHKLESEAHGKPCFEVRIGIHTGPVVAGIVGIKKFQYDIWGDTVNFASRMESSGEAGKVNISGISHDLLKEHFHCRYRGKIMAKNKGELDMYFVDGKKEVA